MTIPMATTVRPARSDDLAVLVAFNQAMARESEGRELDAVRLRSGIAHLLQSAADGRYLVAERAGRMVGCLMLTFEWSDWRNGRFWWIQSVFVVPEARRTGVYRQLHAAVRALAATDPQACGLRLYVEHENHGAMATYAALGMAPTHYRIYEEPI